MVGVRATLLVVYIASGSKGAEERDMPSMDNILYSAGGDTMILPGPVVKTIIGAKKNGKGGCTRAAPCPLLFPPCSRIVYCAQIWIGFERANAQDTSWEALNLLDNPGYEAMNITAYTRSGF